VLFGTNGNVGIGTSSLAARLHVSTSDASVQQRLERTGVGGGITDIGTDSDGLKFFVGGYSAATLRVLFGADGNVGIGTTSLPAFRLQVNSPNASVQQRFQRTGTGGGITDVGADSDGFRFFVGGTSSTTLKVLFGANGKVGIGTFNPDSELTVNGTAHAKEVKVDLTVTGPDYVFEKSYALPALESVKTYIDQNKHLPEVPSAKEMEANGINLSEMNMLLLKKVEELTLYVIEQNKRLDQQQTQIEIQSQEIKTLKRN